MASDITGFRLLTLDNSGERSVQANIDSHLIPTPADNESVNGDVATSQCTSLIVVALSKASAEILRLLASDTHYILLRLGYLAKSSVALPTTTTAFLSIDDSGQWTEIVSLCLGLGVYVWTGFLL